MVATETNEEAVKCSSQYLFFFLVLCKVPSRIFTYQQSHGRLLKVCVCLGVGGCTLRPQNNERMDRQISITLLIAVPLKCSDAGIHYQHYY